jgi:hypothetical protein
MGIMLMELLVSSVMAIVPLDEDPLQSPLVTDTCRLKRIPVPLPLVVQKGNMLPFMFFLVKIQITELLSLFTSHFFIEWLQNIVTSRQFFP